MHELPAGVRTGAVVHARGDLWTILSVRRFDGCALIALEGRGAGQAGRRTTLITPFDAVTLAPRERLPRRRRARVAGAVLGAIGRARPAGGLWTAVEGRFVPLAWQVAPALAALGGATRLLLADAVGLGKTVQAGLVLAELMARGVVDRSLVLTPAGLRDAWVEELRARFGLPVEALDAAAMPAPEWHPAGTTPWTRAPVIVSSIDLVKRPEVRAAVDDRPLDLLIVDEAHHCTPDSDRGAVVARLARAVPWLVLVSATPHAGDARAFRFLLDLGRVTRDEPAMRIFRRTRHEAGMAGRRSTHVLAVTPTEAERRLQEAIHAYARDVCQGPMGRAAGIRLVCGVLARRATSSALAASRTLARRLSSLAGEPAPPVEQQPSLPWSEIEDEDGPGLSLLATPGLPPAADERARLRALLAAADEARAHPSKLARLRTLLARSGEPAVVFSEFRDTLDACLPFVQEVATVRCLHGAMDAVERRRALADFLQGRAQVLLATDVAGEGLNLHARTRLVITIEWPWSPQRLEQRVGRVDRLGQARRVHAVHLTSRGTFEDTVVARLLHRAQVASDGLGPHTGRAVTENVVAAAVLGGAATREPPGAMLAMPAGRDVPADEEARRIAEHRRLAALAAPGEALPAWCLPGRGARVRTGAGVCEPARVADARRDGRGERRRVAVVLEVRHGSRPGRIDACATIGIEVTLARAPAHRREWRIACRAIARDRRVRDAALAAAAAQSPAGLSPWQAVVRRLAAIRGAVDAAPPAEVQVSLFDRRAVREARARAAVQSTLRAHLERKARLLSAPATERDARVLALIPLP